MDLSYNALSVDSCLKYCVILSFEAPSGLIRRKLQLISAVCHRHGGGWMAVCVSHVFVPDV